MIRILISNYVKIKLFKCLCLNCNNYSRLCTHNSHNCRAVAVTVVYTES